mgnify:CR=1 FL=1
MKILITGVAGFIGSNLARALLKRGDDVVGIDNFNAFYSKEAKLFNLDLINLLCKKDLEHFPYAEVAPVFEKLENISSFGRPQAVGKFEFVEVDIVDYKGLARLFKEFKIDRVAHLAGMAGVPMSIKQAIEYNDINVGGTLKILDLAKDNGVDNFVFASSSSVYGSSTDVPFSENQDVDKPISPYAATKRMSEIMNFTYSYIHKIPITNLRFFTVYGPLQRPYGMMIQKFIKLVDHDKPMTLYGDGKMKRDFTYIDDIVKGIIAALDNPKSYEIYNLGNSDAVELLTVVELIREYMGKGEVTFLDCPVTEVPITYADITKASKELGYKPSISLDVGLRNQIEVYKLMPQWYKDLADS